MNLEHCFECPSVEMKIFFLNKLQRPTNLGDNHSKQLLLKYKLNTSVHGREEKYDSTKMKM